MEDDAEAGIFTWSLVENAVYADTAVAALFGLNPMAALLGLSPVDYLARVHQADRDDVVKLWLRAVADGLPYNAIYRVMDGAGTIRQVMAHGRCFRDRTGSPAHFAGIIYPFETPTPN